MYVCMEDLPLPGTQQKGFPERSVDSRFLADYSTLSTPKAVPDMAAGGDWWKLEATARGANPLVRTHTGHICWCQPTTLCQLTKGMLFFQLNNN